MTNQKKVVIISHDYDACLDIRSKVLLNRAIYEAVNAHTKLLKQITKKATEVRVYNGSLRQDERTDRYNQFRNKNGSVFPALERLCQEMSTDEQPWIFEPLLLADPRINGPEPFLRKRGETYNRIINHSMPLYVTEPDIYLKYKKDTVHSKRPLLLSQMWDAYRQNPDATELEFYFIDDHEGIIHDILKNLDPALMPPNMTLFGVKFDSFELMRNNPDAVRICGQIQSSSQAPIKESPTKAPCSFFTKTQPIVTDFVKDLPFNLF